MTSENSPGRVNRYRVRVKYRLRLEYPMVVPLSSDSSRLPKVVPSTSPGVNVICGH